MATYGIRSTLSKTNPFVKISGIEKLAQLCEKYLLTTYGSDAENPNTGCYLKSFIGQTFSSLEEVANLVDREVARVEEQILRLQLAQIREGFSIPPEEQLRSLNLVDVSRTDENSLWGVILTYRVTNRVGESLERELIPA